MLFRSSSRKPQPQLFDGCGIFFESMDDFSLGANYEIFLKSLVLSYQIDKRKQHIVEGKEEVI